MIFVTDVLSKFAQLFCCFGASFSTDLNLTIDRTGVWSAERLVTTTANRFGQQVEVSQLSQFDRGALFRDFPTALCKVESLFDYLCDIANEPNRSKCRDRLQSSTISL